MTRPTALLTPRGRLIAERLAMGHSISTIRNRGGIARAEISTFLRKLDAIGLTVADLEGLYAEMVDCLREGLAEKVAFAQREQPAEAVA